MTGEHSITPDEYDWVTDLRPPPGSLPYKSTPISDENSVPQGLLRDHSTKPGVWAVIQVVSGELHYRQADLDLNIVLTASQCIAIEPEQLHSIKPAGQTRFRVAFWR